MATAQKVKLSTEMQFLHDALKAGRATLQKYSMKRLRRLDQALQPRVIHLNMDHAKNLGDILQVQFNMDPPRDLEPGVLFHDAATDWVGLVDGWHRLEAYRRARLDYFPAYVIEGTREEAVEYAAMANQHAVLERTPEDIKKQIHMLLGMEKWRAASEVALGRHVGIGTGTARKHRITYCEENGIALPKLVEKGNGVLQKRQKSSDDFKIYRDKRENRKSGMSLFSTRIKSKSVPLGETLNEARENLANLIAEQKQKDEQRRRSLSDPVLRAFLLRRNILATGFGPLFRGRRLVNCLRAGRFIFTWTDFQSDNSLPAAFGRVVLASEAVKPEALLPAIICYPDDGPAETIEDIRELGVAVFTPEQFADAISGSSGDGIEQGDPVDELSRLGGNLRVEARARQPIFELLSKQPEGVRLVDIAESLGRSRFAVKTLLYRLKIEGSVRVARGNDHEWRWFLGLGDDRGDGVTVEGDDDGTVEVEDVEKFLAERRDGSGEAPDA